MPIFAIIFAIVIVGVALWAINMYIPMAPAIKNLLNIVVVILLCLWLCNLFGLFSYTLPVRR